MRVRELAPALFADLAQIGAYALAFALVASQWYAHRKLFQRLAFTEPGLTVIDLAWLGMVALVPVPTSVLGAHPTATAACALGVATLVIGVAVSFWAPWLALVLAVLQSAPVVLVLHRTPAGYRRWL